MQKLTAARAGAALVGMIAIALIFLLPFVLVKTILCFGGAWFVGINAAPYGDRLGQWAWERYYAWKVSRAADK